MQKCSVKASLIVGLASGLVVIGCGKQDGQPKNAASLEDLNRALPAIAMHMGDSPPSTNDLAKFLALSGKTLPIPPPGKKLAIDPTNHQFIFADQ